MSLTPVPVPHIALLGANSTDMSALPKIAGVDWLACLRGDNESYEFWRGGDCLFRLDFAAASCAFPDLLAVVGKKRDGMLGDLATSWAEKLPAKKVAFKA